MFENSFVTRLNLRCPYHENRKITHACPKPTCDKSPLLCDDCMNVKAKQHYGHEYELERIDKYMESVTQTIAHQKPTIQRLYKSILSQQQNETLLNWQKQKAQHFQSIQNHLNTLKFQIQEEINNIVIKFEEELMREKENIYKELEAYFQSYRSKFNHFAQLTEPVVVTKQSFVFYQSKNNLSLKLMSIEPSKLHRWLNNLKFNLNRAQLASRKENQYIDRVQKLGLATNMLMDQLPRLRNLDFQSELPLILRDSSRKILSSLVSLRRDIPPQQNINLSQNLPNNHILRSTSMNYISTNTNSRSTSVNNISKDQSRQPPKRYPDM